MGWRTVADVRDHSQAKGTAYTVALMLAERAPDETRIARPGLKRLAADARTSRSTVQRALRWLEDRGEIIPRAHRQGGRGNATEWYIAVGVEGAQSDTLSGGTERVSSEPERVSSDGVKGVTGDTPTKREPDRTEPHNAPEAIAAPPVPDLSALMPLRDVASVRGLPFVPEELAVECRRYPDRDHAREARRFRDYYTPGGAGENVPVKSLRSRWRTWLGRAPTSGHGGRSRPRQAAGPSSDELRAKAAELRERGL